MRTFWIEPVAQQEFDEAAVWYEGEEQGLGIEFIAEVDRALVRIAHHAEFATASIAQVPGGVVRREFVSRFPYVVFFVETEVTRSVIMIRRGSSDPERWLSRI